MLHLRLLLYFLLASLTLAPCALPELCADLLLASGGGGREGRGGAGTVESCVLGEGRRFTGRFRRWEGGSEGSSEGGKEVQR